MKEELLSLIEEKKYSLLKEKLADMLVQDIAELLEELENPADVVIVFRLLHKDDAASVFAYVENDTKEQIVKALSDSEIKNIVEELAIDDAVDFVEEMPANVVERVLKNATPATRNDINKLLAYGEDTAGSIMTTEFLEVKGETKVSEAIEKIREVGQDLETINVIFVTNANKVLIGTLDIKDLILSKPDVKIQDIMEDNVVFGYTYTDQEEISNIFQKYDLLALPIVDNEQRLVGIVTVDDVMEVIEEEATEDIEKIAAMLPSDKSYLKTSVWEIWKNRIPWLLVLMVSATFTGLIINIYEGKLNAISSVLFACVPMIMDTGGNAGSQASVTVIRSLALGELETRDVLRVVWKEVRAALLLGSTLALACFGKLMLLDNLIFGYSGYTPIRCLIVAFALLCTVIIAKLVGCSLPILAKKCKLDPAVVASPFITTSVDALSLMLYCSVAVAVLSA